MSLYLTYLLLLSHANLPAAIAASLRVHRRCAPAIPRAKPIAGTSTVTNISEDGSRSLTAKKEAKTVVEEVAKAQAKAPTSK